MNNIPTTMITTTIKKRKTSQGRKKIEIKKIEPQNNRLVTFSKRRAGLFKKASELCILTGAQIAILVNSPGGHLFSFGHPSADVIIDRYLNNTSSSNNSNGNVLEGSNSYKLPPVMEFNQHYIEVSKELEAEKRRREAIQESKAMNSGCGLMWYEEEVDGMAADELQQYLSSLVELKRKVLVRADELMMIKKTPLFLGPNVTEDVGGSGFANEVVHSTMVPGSFVAPTGFDFGYDYGSYDYNRESMHY
ncbi:putative transcription factor MADS-type1 family [Helianthus annuus]|uniref:Transcription factor MADS-type1 family n=1 Tax=Helianthus annuus TaxID=4232 RepID=A0A9K3IME5_HELAN|nr:agamous-like MADS-box protein AGL29 [Helianthus annuus]KAF5799518.1 putative transcription factor MADS-type1 family [Helianthus annuus]KAJ0550944.1 putative transcription factor MADS-type1 family [Helianthus annuus]KAJ0731986.1 putative transcription factor MADS-type1 family [Helianthus annuus]KAJ0905596.1 putative transcription factor MADS-type1 family [Helianthus annuus]KAJ0908813.1 putative transcription factor MADS-type1 family [Helianthus annuus]